MAWHGMGQQGMASLADGRIYCKYMVQTTVHPPTLQVQVLTEDLHAECLPTDRQRIYSARIRSQSLRSHRLIEAMKMDGE